MTPMQVGGVPIHLRGFESRSSGHDVKFRFGLISVRFVRFNLLYSWHHVVAVKQINQREA